MNRNTSTSKIQRLTFLSLMTALVVVLQLLGSFIHLGRFSVSLVLVPIVLAAAVAGPMAGAWLGFVFGATVLLSGDAAFFFSMHQIGTVVTVLAKGIAAGLGAGLVYKLFEGKNRYLAIILSALACPILNTGVFFLGCLLFFLEPISAIAVGEGYGAIAFILLFYIGGNFIFEILFNVVLAPVILRLSGIWEKISKSRVSD